MNIAYFIAKSGLQTEMRFAVLHAIELTFSRRTLLFLTMSDGRVEIDHLAMGILIKRFFNSLFDDDDLNMHHVKSHDSENSIPLQQRS